MRSVCQAVPRRALDPGLPERDKCFQVRNIDLGIEGATEYMVEPGRVHTVTLTLSSPLEGMPSGAQPIAFETVALHDRSLAVREMSTFILPTH